MFEQCFHFRAASRPLSGPNRVQSANNFRKFSKFVSAPGGWANVLKIEFRKFSKILENPLSGSTWRSRNCKVFENFRNPPPRMEGGAIFRIFFESFRNFENPLSGPDEVETAKFSKIFENPPPPEGGGEHFSKILENFQIFWKTNWQQNFRKFSKTASSNPGLKKEPKQQRKRGGTERRLGAISRYTPQLTGRTPFLPPVLFHLEARWDDAFPTLFRFRGSLPWLVPTSNWNVGSLRCLIRKCLWEWTWHHKHKSSKCGGFRDELTAENSKSKTATTTNMKQSMLSLSLR